jgi:hypothetical protein
MITYIDECDHCAVQLLCICWTLCSQSGQGAQRPAIAQRFWAIWVFLSYLLCSAVQMCTFLVWLEWGLTLVFFIAWPFCRVPSWSSRNWPSQLTFQCALSPGKRSFSQRPFWTLASKSPFNSLRHLWHGLVLLLLNSSLSCKFLLSN